MQLFGLTSKWKTHNIKSATGPQSNYNIFVNDYACLIDVKYYLKEKQVVFGKLYCCIKLDE